MVLYHFCPDRAVKFILRQGITRGGLPLPTDTGYEIYTGWQWLTTDPNPAHQSWATRHVVRESRTAWRLTVEIPDSEMLRVYNKMALIVQYPSAVPLFNGWPGSTNWRVYRGQIPRTWIVHAERMEG